MSKIQNAIAKAKKIHSIKIDGRRLKLSNSDFPHDGRVTLSDPVIEERGPKDEIKIYATCTNETYEPGRRYVCYFTLRGKGAGFFAVT